VCTLRIGQHVWSSLYHGLQSGKVMVAWL